MEWSHYVPFIKQLVGDISRTEREGSLQMQTFASGETGVILVEDTHPQDSFLDVEVTVTGPRRRTQTVRLKQIGPRTYEGQFPLWEKGRYQIVGAGVGEGRTERMIGGLVVPYSQEHLRFKSSPIALSEMVRKTGGRMLTGDESGKEVFLREGGPKSSSRPIADLFLVVLACLIPLDVGVRRIQPDPALLLGWLGIRKKAGSSGETLEALLRRKKAVEFPRSDLEGRVAGPRALTRPTRRASQAAKSPVGGETVRTRKVAPAPPAGEGLSTMERLLAKKKRNWSDEQ